jgi:hypothetical protein
MLNATDGSPILDRLKALSPPEIKVLDQVLMDNPDAAAILLKAFPELQAVMPAPAQPARGFAGGGLVPGHSAGRGDKVSATVPEGTFIIPADVVAYVGGGNTAAGARELDNRFSALPEHKGLGAKAKVPVRLSGGEFAVRPGIVAAIGGGNVDAGSQALGAQVQKLRQENIRHLQSLPPTRK